MKISLNKITVKENRRTVNESKVSELSESIKELGLLNPITVEKKDGVYFLIAGAHRLNAVKKLGYSEIECNVVSFENSLLSELAEIDENLIRNELHWIDRDDELAKRKRIYEELYPETKHGAKNRSNNYGKDLETDKLSVSKTFTEDTAEKTGESSRNIRRSIARSEKLLPETKEVLREKDIPKSKATEIARLVPEEQKEFVSLLKEDKVKDVSEFKNLKKKVEKQKKLADKKEENKKQEKLSILIKPKVFIQSYKDFLPDKKDFDLLLTDPPYSTDIDDIEGFVNDWLPLALDTLKDDARGYICIGAYPREIKAYLDFFANQDRFILDNPLIWTYRNTLGVTPKRRYNLNYQMILHFYSEASDDLDTSITNEIFSVQDINAPDGRQGDRYHKWQKPNELARRMIKHSTKEGDRIIDPFVGSGTFLVNAGKMNRYSIGCDIDTGIIELLKERGCDVQ